MAKRIHGDTVIYRGGPFTVHVSAETFCLTLTGEQEPLGH